MRTSFPPHNARSSGKWVLHSTLAAKLGITGKGVLAPEAVEEAERKGSVV